MIGHPCPTNCCFFAILINYSRTINSWKNCSVDSINSVLHTLAYLVGTLPLGLKGRFYAKLVFVSKGKILRHCCLYVLNGNILRQPNDAKPNTYMHIDSYIKGKFYAVYHHHYNTYIVVVRTHDYILIT